MKDCVHTHLMDQFGDDAAIINEIYAEYVKTSGEKIRELSVAVEADDFHLADCITHTMKGNSLMVGDAPTAEAAIALRKAVQVGDGVLCRKLFADLKGLVDEICR